MKIKITDPLLDTEVELTAEPEDYKGEQGWRILYPSKDSFVIVQHNDSWEVMDEEEINPEIVEAIGKQLHDHSRYI